MLRARSLSARLRADVRSGSVAAMSPIAKTSGWSGQSEVGVDADEPAVVQELGGEPVGVGPYASDRPDHRVGRGGGLPGAPLDRLVGDLVEVEPGRDHGAVTGMQPDTAIGEQLADALPHAAMMLGQGGFAGEVEVDLLVGPGVGEVGGAADRRGPASDDRDRVGGREGLMRRGDGLVDLGLGLHVGSPPEAVGHAGRDDQHVVRLGAGLAVGVLVRDRAAGDVDAGDGAVNRTYAGKSAIALERDAVVLRPEVGPGQPESELLAADHAGLGADADDVGIA